MRDDKLGVGKVICSPSRYILIDYLFGLSSSGVFDVSQFCLSLKPPHLFKSLYITLLVILFSVIVRDFKIVIYTDNVSGCFMLQ